MYAACFRLHMTPKHACFGGGQAHDCSAAWARPASVESKPAGTCPAGILLHLLHRCGLLRRPSVAASPMVPVWPDCAILQLSVLAHPGGLPNHSTAMLGHFCTQQSQHGTTVASVRSQPSSLDSQSSCMRACGPCRADLRDHTRWRQHRLRLP